jgi:hypothetical protein
MHPRIRGIGAVSDDGSILLNPRPFTDPEASLATWVERFARNRMSVAAWEGKISRTREVCPHAVMKNSGISPLEV